MTRLADDDSLAQCSDLLVHDLSDGVVVYDLRCELLHHLEGGAAYLFNIAGGQASPVSKLLTQVNQAFGTSAPASDVVRETLQLLVSAGLLELT